MHKKIGFENHFKKLFWKMFPNNFMGAKENSIKLSILMVEYAQKT